MSDKYNINLEHYDHQEQRMIQDGTVSTRILAQCITIEQLAELLSDYLNVMGHPSIKCGEVVGKHLAQSHPTLQGCFYNFVLAAVIQLVSEFSDPRNDQAVEGAILIKIMLDNNKLKYQPFI